MREKMNADIERKKRKPILRFKKTGEKKAGRISVLKYYHYSLFLHFIFFFIHFY